MSHDKIVIKRYAKPYQTATQTKDHCRTYYYNMAMAWNKAEYNKLAVTG